MRPYPLLSFTFYVANKVMVCSAFIELFTIVRKPKFTITIAYMSLYAKISRGWQMNLCKTGINWIQHNHLQISSISDRQILLLPKLGINMKFYVFQTIYLNILQRAQTGGNIRKQDIISTKNIHCFINPLCESSNKDKYSP